MNSYKKLLSDIVLNGEIHDNRTNTPSLSVFGRQWRFDMKSGFPLITTKRVTLRWVFEELAWFLRGSTDASELQEKGVTIWDEWATPEQCAKFGRQAGDLGPIYGWQWRYFGAPYIPLHERDKTVMFLRSTDQIASLLQGIQTSPESRRLIVTGWHPQQQFEVALPPCHTLWQIKCHPNQEMSLSLYARSIDSFLGLPYNISSYGLLLYLICQVTGYTPRELVISFGDLHIYDDHLEAVETQLGRYSYSSPTLTVTDEFPRWGTPLENLLAVRWEHLQLNDYRHHPKIEAPVAV